MTTYRPNILPVCAVAAIAALALASQAVASTPVYSEDFNSYNTDANLIGQNNWARAGVPNSPSISTLPKGINTTPAVAKNLTAAQDATAAELKRDSFNLPASGIFSYEFDTQRDTGSSCTAAVGFGASASKARPMLESTKARSSFAWRTTARRIGFLLLQIRVSSPLPRTGIESKWTSTLPQKNSLACQ